MKIRINRTNTMYVWPIVQGDDHSGAIVLGEQF